MIVYVENPTELVKHIFYLSVYLSTYVSMSEYFTMEIAKHSSHKMGNYKISNIEFNKKGIQFTSRIWVYFKEHRTRNDLNEKIIHS